MNYSEIFLSTGEVARLENFHVSTIKRNLNDGKYKNIRKVEGVGGKSGIKYEIAQEVKRQGISFLQPPSLKSSVRRAKKERAGEKD